MLKTLKQTTILFSIFILGQACTIDEIEAPDTPDKSEFEDLEQRSNTVSWKRETDTEFRNFTGASLPSDFPIIENFGGSYHVDFPSLSDEQGYVTINFRTFTLPRDGSVLRNNDFNRFTFEYYDTKTNNGGTYYLQDGEIYDVFVEFEYCTNDKIVGNGVVSVPHPTLAGSERHEFKFKFFRTQYDLIE